MILFLFFDQITSIFISPNEVFGNIMVLASPPRPPPLDPDDMNKFYMWVDIFLK